MRLTVGGIRTGLHPAELDAKSGTHPRDPRFKDECGRPKRRSRTSGGGEEDMAVSTKTLIQALALTIDTRHDATDALKLNTAKITTSTPRTGNTWKSGSGKL